jgi:RNA polymerase sigma-70 factor (ECF subfamily)
LLEIDAMLRGMSVKAANAFVMAVACDMTDKEVAAELGVSTRMVRKYVAQAMFHCLLLEARGVAADLPTHAPHIVPAPSSPG